MSNKKKAGNLLPKIGVYSFNAYPLAVYGTKDNPLFQARSIIDYLGIGNVTDVMNRLDDDEKLSSIVSKSGQRREMKFVNESGLYHLIFQSRKPEARKFRRWVTGELLPTLRRTGRYALAPRRRLLPASGALSLVVFSRSLGSGCCMRTSGLWLSWLVAR